jgi:hypothetical protein
VGGVNWRPAKAKTQDPIEKNNYSKKGWGCGLSGRALALHVKGLKFNPHHIYMYVYIYILLTLGNYLYISSTRNASRLDLWSLKFLWLQVTQTKSGQFKKNKANDIPQNPRKIWI